MPTVVRGSDSTFRVILKQGNSVPLDLTNCTEITASFIDENGAAVTRTLTGTQITIATPKGAGIIEVTLSDTFTAAMKVGERQDIQLEFTISGRKMVHIIEGLLTVKPKLGA